MADAEDLKSSGDFSSCGFDSHPGAIFQQKRVDEGSSGESATKLRERLGNWKLPGVATRKLLQRMGWRKGLVERGLRFAES
jgi:hypothetical protein